MTSGTPARRRVRVHLRVEVEITDPAAVTAAAVADLRSGDIDWATEADDRESAAAELGADLLNSLAGLVDPEPSFARVPGVIVRGAHIWAEPAD